MDRGFARSNRRSRPRPGRSHPTLASVAEAVGVSRQTVSNIFNAPHKVQPQTRARVEAEIARQGYRPNRSARSLRTRQSHLLGYCVPVPAPGGNPVMDRFLHALTDAAERRGYHVLLFAQSLESMTPLDGPHSTYEALLGQRAVDGFVLSDTVVGDDRQAWLRERQVPFAAFGRRFADPEIGSWVDVDNAAGTAAVVRHLVAQGHRRLAFLGWPAGSGVGDERQRGFVETARAAGAEIVAVEHTEDVRHHGRRLAADLLAGADAPTGFVCVSDVLAFGCDAAIRARGLTPGRDVAVTGFDDSPAAGLDAVSLTSVRQPLDSAGEQVVQLLVDQLDDPAAPDRHVLLEPALHVRHSTVPEP